jgi:hypothetical protein
LDAFLNEGPPQPSHWTTYDRFKRWLEGRPGRSVIPPEAIEEIPPSWQEYIKAAPFAGELSARLVEILLPRYAWADALAVELSHRFRSAYFNCYVMAAAAVFVALLGILPELLLIGEDGTMAIKFVLVVVEGYLIWKIISIVRSGRSQRWQERWVEYRALAEMLRDVLFLSYVGQFGYIQRPGTLDPASSAWFIWYLRATIREIGLPNAALDGSYQHAQLVAVENNVIKHQIDYHLATSKTLASMHRYLHIGGEVCFLATGAVLLVFLAAHFVLGIALTLEYFGFVGAAAQNLKHALFILGMPVLFVVALLPAVGAAVAGIRETGDFEGFAERSAKSHSALVDLKLDFDIARRRLTLESTSTVLLSTAEVLTADLTAWQSVYGRKRLNFPS